MGDHRQRLITGETRLFSAKRSGAATTGTIIYLTAERRHRQDVATLYTKVQAHGRAYSVVILVFIAIR